jgi:hypothetical protein
MTQPPAILTFRNATLDLVISDALAHLVLRGEQGSDLSTSTLVFSGEGASAGAAVLDALDDIREQCAAHGCAPVSVRAERAFRTDSGVRIWGTLSCVDVDGEYRPQPITALSIDQEGDQWTLTITTP